MKGAVQSSISRIVALLTFSLLIAVLSVSGASESLAYPSLVSGGVPHIYISADFHKFGSRTSVHSAYVEMMPLPEPSTIAPAPLLVPIPTQQSSIPPASAPTAASAPAPAPPAATPVPAPAASAPAVTAAPQPTRSTVTWSCDFENGYCGMYEQSALEPNGHRSTFVSTARSGKTAIMLTTLSGDANIHGSGDWERDDLELPPSKDYCNEGQDEWWGISVYFPHDYVIPDNSAVMDFHHDSSHGQANFHITSSSRGLELRGFYGDIDNPSEYRTNLGPVRRDVWYDFVYHVRWSSSADGFFEAWLNGAKVLSHSGPTLYPGISCYLKLADYHAPFGGSESVIFDRVIRGLNPSDITAEVLEGVK